MDFDVRSFKMLPIREVAKRIDLSEEFLELYGDYKAKVKLDVFKKLENREDGKLVLVSAITPTPAGEGKTTVSIGLSLALNKIGKKAVVALREPSLGPLFGKKGGATGGGRSQVLPVEDINLHFTGDMHAVTTAHNLIAAVIDNHIYRRKEPAIDPRRVEWSRVVDMNDRALRHVVIGLGERTDGVPRETSFQITASSEIMAILCLSHNYEELKEKIGNILVGFTYDGEPVFVRELKVHGAAAAVLKDALKPNLVQTTENTPAFVHGGPFANIAQGTNSIISTKLALKLAEVVVTEAGFGFDLGAEKFFDIVARYAGFSPSVVVLVATVRALKMHGGKKLSQISEPDPEAVERGLPNLEKHLENIEKFGVRAVVAINKFEGDTEDELKVVKDFAESKGYKAVVVEYFQKGSEGGIELAEAVLEEIGKCTGKARPLYDLELPVEKKIEIVSKEIYGSKAIDFTPKAKRDLKKIKELGFDSLPVCIAKTQRSLSDNPELLGRPKDFLVTVREIKIASGAGFTVPITGEILLMPGLPKTPAAEKINILPDGTITGMF